MVTLTLKNVPDTLLERIRSDAQRERRSLNQHAIHLLEQALGGARPSFGEAIERYRRAESPIAEDLSRELEGLRERDGGREVDLELP